MFNMYADVCRTSTLESVRPYVVRCSIHALVSLSITCLLLVN